MYRWLSLRRVDVGVVSDFLVRCQQVTPKDSSSCDDDLISRIMMEAAWQLRRLDGYVGRQIHERYARICQRIREPLIQCDRQDQPTKFNQFGDFPRRNCANSDFVILVVLDQFRVRTGEPGISVNPPHPDVSIQYDHERTSQSDSAAGAVGSSN